MKWQKVRDLFPDQFVLVSILDYTEKYDKKIVHEVSPIRSIPDNEANKELFRSEPGTIVYHTANEECIIHIRRDPFRKVERVQ
ncbi:hypothetical protein [Alteribacillus sp. YIM 98480]|uniref:hypothetical protein n=1 Tax=Alteribacillus sp. YIM 98480 TaxID=2606599 RepID=UPI00131E4BA8|nr:hypothetical protein [Alteribacillus sp. YIM 98480]